jgi:addiction module RelE/StbE family toxin
MKVINIEYSSIFIKQIKNIPRRIQEKAILKEQIFRENPLHPSLRLHNLKGKLDGYWSISINRYYRILFKIKENGDIVFLSIGTHAIYD